MTRRVLHLITSLEGGGTENFLYQILAHSPAEYAHRVLYLKKDGVIGDRIRGLKIPVNPAGSPFSLYQTLRQDPPHILHTCLYSAHILGRCLGRLANVSPIVTSQRAIDIWQSSWQTGVDRWTLPLSDLVIVNSQAAADVIEKRRGRRTRPEILTVPNGVDTTRFKPSDRAVARQRYALPVDAIVGGTLMRLHPEKGADFIPAFVSTILPQFPRLHLLIGGVGPLEKSVKTALAGHPDAERIHFIGWENDTPMFLSACDFFWSLSREESFPQTLVEASAMGLPWVAPATGGVPEFLSTGVCGKIYPRLNIAQAAQETASLLNTLPALASAARQAISIVEKTYSLPRMIERLYSIFSRF